MMMDFIRLAQVAANMEDADSIARKDDALLTTRERFYSEPLKVCPTLMQWCDFFFFCGGQVVGPSTEYRDLVDFINLKGAYGLMPPGSHLMPTLVRFAQTLLMTALTIVLGMWLDRDFMLTPSFAEWSFLAKTVY